MVKKPSYSAAPSKIYDAGLSESGTRWRPLIRQYSALRNWIERSGIRRTPPPPRLIEMFWFFASNASENAKIKVREISAKKIYLKEFDSCKSSGILQFLIWILRWRWQSHQSQGFRVTNMSSGYIKMIILQFCWNSHRINTVETFWLYLVLHIEVD